MNRKSASFPFWLPLSTAITENYATNSAKISNDNTRTCDPTNALNWFRTIWKIVILKPKSWKHVFWFCGKFWYLTPGPSQRPPCVMPRRCLFLKATHTYTIFVSVGGVITSKKLRKNNKKTTNFGNLPTSDESIYWLIIEETKSSIGIMGLMGN